MTRRPASNAFQDAVAISSLFLSPTEPKQTVENKPVLGFTFKGRRELFAGLMLVIDIIVTHVEIDHAVALIRPNDRKITFVPDFMCLRSGSKGIARRIN